MALGKMLNDYLDQTPKLVDLLNRLHRERWTSSQIGVVLETLSKERAQAVIDERARDKKRRDDAAIQASEQERWKAEKERIIADQRAAEEKAEVARQMELRARYESEQAERKKARDEAEFEAFVRSQPNE